MCLSPDCSDTSQPHCNAFITQFPFSNINLKTLHVYPKKLDVLKDHTMQLQWEGLVLRSVKFWLFQDQLKAVFSQVKDNSQMQSTKTQLVVVVMEWRLVQVERLKSTRSKLSSCFGFDFCSHLAGNPPGSPLGSPLVSAGSHLSDLWTCEEENTIIDEYPHGSI